MDNRRRFDFTLTPTQVLARNLLQDIKKRNIEQYEAALYRLYQDVKRAPLTKGGLYE